MVASAGLLAASAGEKKFIEIGWDIPDTAFLRENFREMEKEGAFSGVLFRAEAKSGTETTVTTLSGWNGEPWEKAWFQPALDDLRACRFVKFTDNFLLINATPQRIEWDNDAGWMALEGKARIGAWLAQAGGAKGLALDFEPYGQNQWKFDPAKGRTFSETSALARKRGAQFVRGVAAEMPHAVLLTFFLNSVVLRAGRADDPDAILAQEHYGLLPAFFNGMLDAAPPGMVIVDGCENGYYLDSVEAYQRAALDMRSWNGPSIRLVAPENRAKYRMQVQAGFGFYLDMFVNAEGNQYFRGPLEGSRLKHLERNLAAARDAADEYVWIYGEQCRWWSGLARDKPWREEPLKQTAGKGRAWEQTLPGITRTIAWTRNLEAAAREALARQKAEGTAANLLVNADFREPPAAGAALPPHWSAWQEETHATGTFSWDEKTGEGSARAASVFGGCFIQKIVAAPSEIFVVQAQCLTRGASTPSLTIRWQTNDEKWTHEADDQTFTFAPGSGKWTQASGVATVPPGAGRLVVLLSIRGQQTAADGCWFDNVEVHRIKPAGP
ncbi:MAG: hypothetical protein KA004_11280 [Verrucomicrobiales bacterium]|nr:hypothetical protein [Verrucomicrobiales bacterium]